MGTTQQHWENEFRQKKDDQKSWFQQYPSTSIKFIEELGLPKNASVIDAGGEDSNLVDALQYSKNSMLARFKTKFEMIRCMEDDHEAPSKIIQRFYFAVLEK